MKPGAVAANPFLIPQSLPERLAQGDATVLDRMVRIHVQIALAAQVKVHGGMLRKQRQHVVEERNAGGNPGFPGAIHIESKRDLRLAGLAADFGAPGCHVPED